MQVSLVLRRCAIVLALIAISAWFALRSARAELTHRALTVGRLVLDLPEEWLSAAPRDVWINGARVRIVTGRSELPLAALMTRLEASCRARSRLLGAPWRARLGEARIPALLDGVVRAESERDGVVACLELGPHPLGAWGLLSKLERFAERLDLEALGGVRMVRAEARAEGSFFVAAFTEGPLPLTTMFPEHGEAPGFDHDLAGRPSAARRVFTALQQGGEPTINVYESAEHAQSAFEHYARDLDARGFERLTASLVRGPHAGLFTARGRYVLVSAHRQRERTMLAVISLDRAFTRNFAPGPADTAIATRQAL